MYIYIFIYVYLFLYVGCRGWWRKLGPDDLTSWAAGVKNTRPRPMHLARGIYSYIYVYVGFIYIFTYCTYRIYSWFVIIDLCIHLNFVYVYIYLYTYIYIHKQLQRISNIVHGYVRTGNKQPLVLWGKKVYIYMYIYKYIYIYISMCIFLELFACIS
jgi:hypothetical protein